MAESDQGQDKTEEPTPERREEFREKGQIAVSREISSVLVLAATIIVMTFAMPYLRDSLGKILTFFFYKVRSPEFDIKSFPGIASSSWLMILKLILPLFAVTGAMAVFATFSQTRMNWSWKKVSPDFTRMNPLKGLKNMVASQAVVNLLKGVGKMLAVSLVSYLILRSEWFVVPGLLQLPIAMSWAYWGEITKLLFWSVAGLLIFVAAGDYLYNFLTMEKQLKMTKQEVKEDLKKHEVDPQIKNRIKRAQREIAFSKMTKGTKEATVLVTNPTHYAVALKYELGMNAPVVVAKGIDHNALHMRRIAKESDIPVVEDKPLARTLYSLVEVGQEIPESLYNAISGIIRSIFRMKGKPLSRNTVENRE